MIDKKIFKKALGEKLRSEGFVNKGQSWYLEGGKAIVVINMQKCDYDEKYFLNFGVWLKALGDVEFPKENHCHIAYRLDVLFPEQDLLIQQACSLENSTVEKLTELVEFLGTEVVPFSRQCLALDFLRDSVLNGRLTQALVMLVAKEQLGI